MSTRPLLPRLPLLGLLMLLAWPAALHAQEGGAEEEGPQGCRRCDHRGVVDCGEHDEELRALEPHVFCNVNAACVDCGGALVIDCEKCDGGPENAAMEARRAELAAWAAQKHEVEGFVERALLRIDSPHLELLGSIDELQLTKKKRIGGHRFLHWLARDGEKAAVLIEQHYGAKREDFKAAQRLWFWQEMEDHKRIMADYLGSGGSGDFKALGRAPLFSVCTSDEVFGNDATALLTLGVHNVTHMMLSNHKREEWIGDLGAGWFDAGAAHWYEEKVFGIHRHYCVDEAPLPYDWNEGMWRAELRKLLDKEKDSILPALVRKQTGELRDYEHAQSWSVYDWLVATKPEALAPMLAGLKDRQPSRDLFQELLEMNLIEAEQAWRAWVDENYPRRPLKKPR